MTSTHPFFVSTMIRVLLFEDNTDLAESLGELMKDTDDIRLIAHYSNAQKAERHVAYHHPDVVLMDIDMPVENGLQGLRAIRTAGSGVMVLMFTVMEDNESVFQAICHGASGYLLKQTAPERILDSIREAMGGGAPMTPSIARKVLALFAQPFKKGEDLQKLTAREHDVLSLLVRGYGICVDISRSWWIGEARPSNAMISAMNHALDHNRDHQARLKLGVTIKELTFGGHRLEDQYWKQKYSCKMHGVGLCDEWPFVPYADAWVDGAFEVALEPGMVLCTETLVSPEGGDFSIKLEDQVLITETGCENLTRYPFDPRLLG